MKKHGIYIVKHKKHNTKKIYNNGNLLIRYLYQPKQIKFKSKMVNDDNQHFSGGWSIEGIDLSDEALLRRVVDGLKPMAIIHKWKKELEEYQKIVDILKDINRRRGKNKLVYKEYDFDRTYCLTVACKGVLKNIFDLKTLKEDYESNGINIDISKAEDKALSDYFEDWDAPDDESKIEYWETGLILGYPIENTISAYRDGVR